MPHFIEWYVKRKNTLDNVTVELVGYLLEI